MILLLRKRHLQVWMALLFLLPIGILAAWFSIPKPIYQKTIQPQSVSPLEMVLRESGNERFHLQLRATADKDNLQLEIHNTAALEYPSALVYVLRGDPGKAGGAESQVPDKAELLGRIQERGVYRFSLRSGEYVQPYYILLFDIIHHQRIDLLKL
jgi:hypothetical protein